jgi:CDP-4-dehydro-6-deoxyglucose reductase, E1
MIPLMKNTFLNEYETKAALAEFILKSSRLSMGEYCFEFEKQFASFQKSNDAVLFNSGGSANLALIQSLKNLGRLKHGDKIGFSALTWSTNVMPIIQMGFVPVPVDVEPITLNVMCENLKDTHKDIKLNAFFTTNVLGFAGDLDNIKEYCKNNDIILLEDNCESLGTKLDEGMTGNFGLASSFSFFVAHHMSTIEGGMICSDDEELMEMLRIVRANGWDRNLHASKQKKWRKKFEIKNEFQAKYSFYDLGFNFRPTEITGFLGVYQLKFLKENIEKREENFMFLINKADSNNDLIKINYSHLSVVSNFAFPVVCKSESLKEKYFNQFSGAGVEIRPMIAGNIQHQPFYRKYYPQEYSLPGTEFIHNCSFYFGNYPQLSEVELNVLSSCLTKY